MFHEAVLKDIIIKGLATKLEKATVIGLSNDHPFRQQGCFLQQAAAGPAHWRKKSIQSSTVNSIGKGWGFR
jgi:hypothetical protein